MRPEDRMTWDEVLQAVRQLKEREAQHHVLIRELQTRAIVLEKRIQELEARAE